MHYKSPFSRGPSQTHKGLKNLLFTIGALSVLSALFIKVAPLTNYLSLSLWGVKNFFLWQFFTHFLTFPCYEISFGYLIQLGFYLYILWWIGSSIIDRFGMKKFYFLFFSTGLLSGLFALLFSSLFHSLYLFSGFSLVVLASLFAWMMINSEAKLLLFFALPLSARMLVTVVVGISLFSDLSKGDYIHFFTYLFTLVYVYFFTLFFWKGGTGFSFLMKFEEKVKRIRYPRYKKNPSWDRYRSDKIYDFTSQEATFDEEKFLNAMLKKIKEEGENSLSPSERKQMEEIIKKNKH